MHRMWKMSAVEVSIFIAVVTLAVALLAIRYLSRSSSASIVAGVR